MNKKFVIALDFDGTIVEEGYPDIGDLRIGAKKYINKLYEEGFTLIINTCRTGTFEGNAYAFLQLKGINFHYMNCNLPEMISSYGMDCRKISADLYIDDKCLTGLPEWPVIYEMVHKRYNEKYGKEIYKHVVRTNNLLFFEDETLLKKGDTVTVWDEKDEVRAVVQDTASDKMCLIAYPFTNEEWKNVGDIVFVRKLW